MYKSLLIFLLLGLSGWSFGQTANEIIRKADAKSRGNSSVSEIKITIVRPDWSREMVMKSWSSGEKLGLILMTQPARDKGTAFLKRDKEVWNWVPAIERTVKLPPSMMTQDWMGTDFKNDDLVKESSVVHDYDQKLLGDSVIDDRACWKIELTPKPEAAVVWGKIFTWIDKAEYVMLRSEYYDEDGYLVNIMKYSDIKDLGGRTLPARMEMIPVDKEGQKTIMEFLWIRFDEPIKDSFFTVQNMKRLRP